MQFSTVVKLALVTAQIGMVVATPVAPEAPQLLGLTCETDADCNSGAVCEDITTLLSSILGIPLPISSPDITVCSDLGLSDLALLGIDV
ncbi:hypothetical protein FKP32DRAFT_1671201 [Trametes sanguinea]|nr:hypothetical protein FKP32DRAFT_1671201 [Trametes sanguinea]